MSAASPAIVVVTEGLARVLNEDHGTGIVLHEDKESDPLHSRRGFMRYLENYPHGVSDIQQLYLYSL